MRKLTLVLLLFLMACGGAVPTPTKQPTAAPTFRSGGFAKSRAEWESMYQKPEQEQSGTFTYANGNYFVMYTEGRVAYLEHRWGDKDAKSLDFATGAAKPLLPSDAVLKQTYKARSGNTVDLYHSDLLAPLLSAGAFIGGAPGDFTIIYRDITGKVTSYVIALGNNP